MKGDWGSVLGSRRSAAVCVLLCLTLAALLGGCGTSADGGGRGTGIGSVGVSGNIARSGPALSGGCANVDAPTTVVVRGTDLRTEVGADCTFALRDVPPGDVTLDFVEGERTTSLTVNDVPPATEVVLIDVRLGAESADAAGIEVKPSTTAPGREFAIIAAPPSGDAPLEVQFSFAPEPRATTQARWSFGDRSPSSSELTPAHTYAARGDYVVTLVVAEQDRRSQEVYLVVRVTEPAPPAPLSVRVSARPQAGAPPLTVTLEATVQGAAPLRDLVWDFGDRSPSLTTDRTTVEHTYDRVGSFLALVTATDVLGAEAGASFPIVVERSAVSPRPTGTATERQPTPSPTPAENAPPSSTPTSPAASPTPTATPGFNAPPTATVERTAFATPRPSAIVEETKRPTAIASPASTPSANATAFATALRTPTVKADESPRPTLTANAIRTPTAQVADSPRPTMTADAVRTATSRPAETVERTATVNALATATSRPADSPRPTATARPPTPRPPTPRPPTPRPPTPRPPVRDPVDVLPRDG